MTILDPAVGAAQDRAGGLCVRYVRVSGSAQGDNYSVKDQLDETEALARAEGYADGGLLVQEIGSAESIDERPGMTRLVRMIHAGQVKLAVFGILDRVSRDLVDQELFFRACDEHGVDVRFVRQQPSSWMERVFRGMYAQHERGEIKRRTYQSRKRRVEAGLPLRGPGHYGHEWRPEPAPHQTRGRYVKHAETAPVVRLMGELVLAGWPIRRVCAELVRLGHKPPGHYVPYKKGPKGAKWYPGTVSRILADPAYAGSPEGWKYEATKLKPPAPGVKAPRRVRRRETSIALDAASFEPIFSPAEYAAIQRVLDANKANAARRTAHPEDFLLRGSFAVCGACRNPLSTRVDKDGRRTYYCPNRGTHRRQRCAAGLRITRELVDPIVERTVLATLHDWETLRGAIEETAKDDGQLESQIATARREEAEWDDRYRLATAEYTKAKLARNAIRAETFEGQMTEAETMIAGVRARLVELEASAAAWRERSATLVAMERWREEIAAIFGELDFAQKRALFAGLGLRVVVHQRGAPVRLEVYLQIKLDRRLYRGFTAAEVEHHAELLSVSNASYFEMLHEPPGLSADDFQWYLAEPLRVNADGDIVAPERPGLGVEPDPDKLAKFRL